MNNIERIYRDEILRAVLGPGAQPAQAVDLSRLNLIAVSLAASEQAHGILRANGHGGPGLTIVEAARQVPANAGKVIRAVFGPRGAA